MSEPHHINSASATHSHFVFCYYWCQRTMCREKHHLLFILAQVSLFGRTRLVFCLSPRFEERGVIQESILISILNVWQRERGEWRIPHQLWCIKKMCVKLCSFFYLPMHLSSFDQVSNSFASSFEAEVFLFRFDLLFCWPILSSVEIKSQKLLNNQFYKPIMN